MLKKCGSSRRDFLRTTVQAAGVGLAFPLILPSSTLKADDAVPPSDRVVIGFIGMGKQGGFLLRGFLNEPGTQVVALCDVDRRKLAQSMLQAERFYAERAGNARYHGVTGYTDFREVLERNDIDAVVAALPDHWHALAAVEAARFGKDIYCEKPLANSIGEARAMVTAARRYGRVFQTGSMQRSDEKFRFACELVRSGYIGQLRKVTVNIGGPPDHAYALPAEPVPDYLDWDSWVGPAPWRPYSSVLAPPLEDDRWARWRYYWDFGGGGMTDWGAHHFDIGQWGLGMDDSGPVEIHPPGGNGHKVLTYRYRNGVIMTREEGVNGVLFTGTEGTVEVNRGYLKTAPPTLARVRLKPGDVHLYPSNNHFADWLRCIRTRSRPICDVEIGCRSVTVCHLGNIAYLLNRSLYWDPAKETFLGDEAANRLLSRPYRSPWRLSC
jgi:predicted dehydrogenase